MKDGVAKLSQKNGPAMTTDAAPADAKKYYTLTLTIADLEVRDGKSGPYALMTVQHTPATGPNAGQVQTLPAFCGGRAYAALREELVREGTIRVSGQFEKASDPSQPQRFRIVGKPLARGEAQTGATMLVNDQKVPVSEYEALVALWRDCPDIHAALTEPMRDPVRPSAKHPHVVAGRVVPYEQDRKFRMLLGQCPALRRALIP